VECDVEKHASSTADVIPCPTLSSHSLRQPVSSSVSQCHPVTTICVSVKVSLRSFLRQDCHPLTTIWVTIMSSLCTIYLLSVLSNRGLVGLATCTIVMGQCFNEFIHYACFDNLARYHRPFWPLCKFTGYAVCRKEHRRVFLLLKENIIT